jgi:hypothetical protein
LFTVSYDGDIAAGLAKSTSPVIIDLIAFQHLCFHLQVCLLGKNSDLRFRIVPAILAIDQVTVGCDGGRPQEIRRAVPGIIPERIAVHDIPRIGEHHIILKYMSWELA